MFESDTEDNVFRRRLMKEVAAGIPVHFSFYSPSVKVQVQSSAEHLSGANGRYVGDAVTIEFVPEDAAAVERVREFVWRWEEYNAFTAVRKGNHIRRGDGPADQPRERAGLIARNGRPSPAGETYKAGDQDPHQRTE